MAALVLNGDALEVLRTIPDASVDACVTDPPAGIAFMGKSWDRDKGGRDAWIAWLRGIMVEVLRTLKPGAHALVWALPRTSHWTATAVEDAGFEIRDVGVHLFGTGFPKSLNVSKAIDAAAGVEPTVVGSRVLTGTAAMSTEEKGGTYAAGAGARPGATKEVPVAEPTSPEAKQWDGFGTALKPAAEHWILARKPLEGTVAANVLEWGTGALNVDGCRIEAPAGDRTEYGLDGDESSMGFGGHDANRSPYVRPALGRWPANVTLQCDCCADAYPGGAHMSDCPAAALDAQSGDRPGMSGGGKHRADAAPGMFGAIDGNDSHIRADSGGASRFFYVAKPSTREREAGCEHLPRRSAGELVDREEGSAGMSNPRAGAGRTSKGRANHHPTVKSIALMRWLVRLVTPPGGLVLDPFCGSGSTGCAAVLEGASFIGIEQDPEFVAIAEARIKHHDAT